MNRPLISLTVLTMMAMVLASCGDKKKGAAPAPPVAVNLYTVQQEQATYYEQFPGNVVAMMQVDIRAEAEGYVTGIYFTEGTRVTKGQKLYTIDDRKYQAIYNQASANVKVAEANLAQAQKDADRYKYLDQHEAVAKQVLDHAMTTLQNATQQLAAARQDMARTQTDLGYSTIRAPFDGTIGISQVKLGNTVVPGQTILNTISTTDPMAVDIVINEKEIPKFIALQQKAPSKSDSIFTLVMPDNSTYSQPGHIQTIDRGVNPQTGTIIVRLVFPNGKMMLRAGMSCVVKVKNDDTARQMMIPLKAVTEQMGEYFVYIVKDTVIKAPADAKVKGSDKPGPHALQRKVQLGQAIADKVIVRSGLEAGEQIVVDGVQKLHNGSEINTESGKK